MATFRITRSDQAGQVRAAVAGMQPTDNPPPTTGTSTESSAAHWYFSIPALVVVGVAAWLTVELTSDPSYSEGGSRPIAGLSLFALFFVTALALERLLEPVAALVPGTTSPANDFESKKDAAAEAVEAAAKTPGDPALRTAAQNALDDAAAAMAKVDRHKGDRAIVLWTFASVLGIVGAATLKLYFLRVVGIADVPRGLEIAATGLIIGAGTKPLHDLVAGIQEKKDQAKAATRAAT